MPPTLSYARRRVLSRSRPELGWWGVVLLLTCCLFMTSAKFTASEPLVWLPGISRSHCSTEAQPVVFSLDTQGHAYFQAGEALQAAIVEQVGKTYGIHFSENQRRELIKTAFIDQDIRQLPAWLDAPVRVRRQFIVGIPADQLPAYVASSRQVSESQLGYPAYFGLRADQRLPARIVMSWLQQMQQQGVHHFHLISQMG